MFNLKINYYAVREKHNNSKNIVYIVIQNIYYFVRYNFFVYALQLINTTYI